MPRLTRPVLLFLCLPAAAALAQSRVEVVGDKAQYDARRDDTTTRIVVGQDELTKYGDTTLADVLKRQPGIAVVGGGPGGGGEIRMRGLGNGYTQILLNGDPAPAGFALESLAPELVERIEIQRAATADQSAQAIAGTINIVLKRKVSKAQRDLNLRAERSNVFFSPSAALLLADKRDAMDCTVALDVRRGRYLQDYVQTQEGLDAAGAPDLLRSVARHNVGTFTQVGLTPRVNWLLDGGGTLTWQGMLQALRSTGDVEGRWRADLGSLPGYPNERSFPGQHIDQLSTQLTWARELGAARKLEAKVGIEAGRARRREHDWGFDGAWQPVFERDAQNQDDTRGLTFSGRYSRRYVEGHEFDAGWDGAARSLDAHQLQTGRAADAGKPLAETQRTDADLRATLRRLAAYAQDDWTVTPRVSVYLGLRWETLRTHAGGNDFAPIDHAANVWSPIVQALWKLPDSKQDRVRVALARTYRGDGLERLVPRVIRTLNNSATTPDRAGNPALKPELAWGVDAALEHNGGNGEQASLSAYVRRIGDVVHDDTRFIDGRWLATPVNGGNARTRGVEFDGKLPLRAWFKHAGDVDLHLNLARNWSSVSDVPGPYNRLAGQTPFTANAGIDWRANALLGAGANFTFRSAGPQQISRNVSTYDTVKRELDVYALYKLSPRTQLRVTGANLLAEPTTEIARYADAAGSLRSTAVYPFSATLRVALEMKL